MNQVDVATAHTEMQVIRSTVTGKFLSLSQGELVDAIVNNQAIPAHACVGTSWTKKAQLAGFTSPLDQNQRNLLMQCVTAGWFKHQQILESRISQARLDLERCDQYLAAFDQGLVPACHSWRDIEAWSHVSRWIVVQPVPDMTKYIASNKEWLNSRIRWTQAEIKGDQRTASQLRRWIQEPVEWIVIKTQTVITFNVL